MAQGTQNNFEDVVQGNHVYKCQIGSVCQKLWQLHFPILVIFRVWYSDFKINYFQNESFLLVACCKSCN